ncbi:MAG TPA: alpha/beta hydrolase [Actinocrinis sp.]|nr:alpha/beta hydrolase [Actinocrinis sp.]
MTPPEPPNPVQTLHVRSRDGNRLHVEVHGNPDGPTVVLSHGWTCSIRFWWPVIAALAAHYRLVAYDQRGHGGSDLPGKDGYSVPALAEDLAAVIDAAAGPDRMILVGHSMGGMTIMAAGTDPAVRARTRAVLLASTGAHDLAVRANLVPTRLLGRIASRRMLRGASPLGRRTRLSTRLLAYGTLGPKPARALAIENATIIHACPRQVRAGWGRVLEFLDVRAGAAALTVPTAVLVGTADRLTPPRHAEELAGLLADLHSRTVLPRIGHMTPMEDPATVADLVRRLDAASRTTAGGDSAAGQEPEPESVIAATATPMPEPESESITAFPAAATASASTTTSASADTLPE